MRTSLAPVQALVDNALPEAVDGGLVGVIGTHPSTYSKSPDMWNAALRALGLPATHLPFDVPAPRVRALLTALRDTPAWWGASITVPHKDAVLNLLDDVDPSALAAGAVNVVVRTDRGRLVGANTDGAGLVLALLGCGDDAPLVDSLYGAVVLVLGGGGAASATVAGLAPLLGGGEVVIANRTSERAHALAERARALGGRARVAADIDAVLPSVDVLVNASSVGQAGVWKREDGWTMLEAYSPLAPAAAPIVRASSDAAFRDEWPARAAAGIDANHAQALARMRRLRAAAVVVDVIYAPAETVLLRHARATGHRAANGRRMLIGQAVEALVRHVCARMLAQRGLDPRQARDTTMRAMTAAFGA
jgi:shikimate dehydrogenase